MLPSSPDHLSARARACLEHPDVLPYPFDWASSSQVQTFREIAHPRWNSLNAEIDFNYEVSTDVIAGVTVERVSTTDPDSGFVLLHLHGGMFCAGNPEIDRALNAPMARASGVEVISVDYRLAPEHPYPAAIDDALAVYQSLLESGLRVAIYGESAGGGLAAACALASRDAGLGEPAALGLISPMLDLTGSSDTYRTHTTIDPDYGDTSILLEPATAYAGTTNVADPKVSPLFATLHGLCPVLLQVGSREVLLGDSIRFAQAARRSHCDVTIEILDGGWHNYPVCYGTPEADAAVIAMAEFLTKELR